MKWPSQLMLIRHGQSAYNVLRERKKADPAYQEFLRLYEHEFDSHQTRRLAEYVQATYALRVSDYETPLTLEGEQQATVTGGQLSRRGELTPNIIFVSPYLRARHTFRRLQLGWPALSDIPTVIDDRIREQEHGMSLLYNDWRVFHVMNPEQKALRELLGPYWYQYPQGESVSNVRDRIRSFQGTLIRECAGKRVLLVTHHLTILSIRANLERLSPEQFIRLDENEKPVNCGVTTYDGHPGEGRAGKLRLTNYNLKHY